jgi:hypothetical protein
MIGHRTLQARDKLVGKLPVTRNFLRSRIQQRASRNHPLSKQENANRKKSRFGVASSTY